MKNKEQKIQKAIEIVYSSLKSHLPYTRGKLDTKNESHIFHKRCVREYAEVIKILSELL